MRQKRLSLGLAVAMVCFAPAWASEPGQPLNCSDWVFLEQGYSCTEWVPFGCASTLGSNAFCNGDGFDEAVFDNAGTQYRWERIELGPSPCGVLYRMQILTYDGETQQVFAHLDERCGGTNDVDLAENFEGFGLQFDDKKGRLLLTAIKSRCLGPQGTCGYDVGHWVAAIDGFATTFEVLQTYTPTASEIGFRVPYMPEGFQFADFFDTYYGSLATVGEWTQAQPLQCSYPASAPGVGDYLTVEDTLPTPSTGQGYYYVTAANYMGQSRYGRQSSGGVLTGRDPAMLPGCE